MSIFQKFSGYIVSNTEKQKQKQTRKKNSNAKENIDNQLRKSLGYYFILVLIFKLQRNSIKSKNTMEKINNPHI